MNKRVIIYTITDANTGLIHYVGATSQSLEKRFNQHCYDGTLKVLRNPKMCPVIEAIDETNGVDNAAFLESYWIHQLRTWGFPLQNRRKSETYRGDVSRYKNQKKRYLKITVSETEYKKILAAYPYGQICNAINYLINLSLNNLAAFKK